MSDGDQITIKTSDLRNALDFLAPRTDDGRQAFAFLIATGQRTEADWGWGEDALSRTE